jgi:FMN phosphatase YigB (HAD superfamily)
MRAVILDIGGVLEYTPPTGHTAAWEAELGLASGDLDRRMEDVFRAGSIGTVSEQEVHAALVERLGLSPAGLERYLAGLWDEYCGTLNAELTAWFSGLRPRYRTGIVSNSFVGAREEEEQRYGFASITDTIVYSHEVGVRKPDPAIYLLACERLGVRPEEAVFLDDKDVAVELDRRDDLLLRG